LYEIKKYDVGLASNGIMFIPNFGKVCQLDQKLKWGKRDSVGISSEVEMGEETAWGSNQKLKWGKRDGMEIS
jgi:hypothetical protein